MAPSCTSPAAAEASAARHVRPQTVPRTRFQRRDRARTATAPIAAMLSTVKPSGMSAAMSVVLGMRVYSEGKSEPVAGCFTWLRK